MARDLLAGANLFGVCSANPVYSRYLFATNLTMPRIITNLASIRDLTPDILAAPGRPRILPASYYRTTTMDERAVFAHRHGIYGLPTVELIEWVKGVIGGRSAIEIGAGHGGLAAALGIPATDNRMQEHPLIRAHYAATRQPVVIYGDNVEPLDAQAAVAKYRPQVVVASWVTHVYSKDRDEAEGNMFGVDEDAILDAVDTYIFIGNTQVHAPKTIWSRPHKRHEPDWVYSRAVNGSPDFVAVWDKA